MKTGSPDVRAVVRANRDAYRRIASTWQSLGAGDRDPVFRAECRRLFAARLPGPRILDLGCGTGQDAMAFAAGGRMVTAVDIVTDFLNGIKARPGGASVSLVGMDMVRPCFAPSTFDGIFAFASFLHVPREAAAETLSNLHGLLASGGVLFLHHVASRLGLEGYSIKKLLGSCARAEAFCHTEKEMVGLLEAAGFHSIAVHRLHSDNPPSEMAIRFGLDPYQVIAENG